MNIATANDACAEAVAYASPDAVTSSARFELFGPGGVGWECYSVGEIGGDQHGVLGAEERERDHGDSVRPPIRVPPCVDHRSVGQLVA